MKTGSEIVKEYKINGENYMIRGCWDDETPENEFNFYEICNDKGECLHLGDYFWTLPTYKEIIEFVEQNSMSDLQAYHRIEKGNEINRLQAELVDTCIIEVKAIRSLMLSKDLSRSNKDFLLKRRNRLGKIIKVIAPEKRLELFGYIR